MRALGWHSALGALGVVWALAGCELTEVTLVDSQEVLLVEGTLQLQQGPAFQGDADVVRVFLHRTLENDGSSVAVPGATVTVSSDGGGWSMDLLETELEACATVTPDLGTGTCYASSAAPGTVTAGDRAELHIDLPDGGKVQAASVVPGDFDLTTPDRSSCRVPAEHNFEVAWTKSEGAWAYLTETRISGLREVLEPRGIEVEHDPLNLLGLSVSASDTTIVYPSELGLFSRTELDQDLALELQKGLPVGTEAVVVVAAADRNYINWARGGNFNPSGPVRVPSVVGDGTGVFGSVVVRSFQVGSASELPAGEAPCGPAVTQ